jgi:hypothetical protein
MFSLMSDDFDVLAEQQVDTKRQIIKFNPTHTEIKTKDDLTQVIASYFDYINQNDEIPTFTGLALTLGISRYKLLSLPQDNDFTPIIEKAKQYIVDYAEKQLFLPKSAAGIQFWLKNNDNWVDKQEVSISKSKTMLEIIEELEAQDNIIEGQYAQPQLQETNFLQHGVSNPSPGQTATDPTVAPEQRMAPQKPLQNY